MRFEGIKNYISLDGCHNCKHHSSDQAGCTVCLFFEIFPPWPGPGATTEAMEAYNLKCIELESKYSVEPWGKCDDYECESEGDQSCHT